jgi:hypothetical protein
VRYRRHGDVLAQPVDDQVILLSADQSELLTLNGPGAAVWSALAEPGTTDEVTARIVAAWPGADAAVVRADVVAFVERLVGLGAVVAAD